MKALTVKNVSVTVEGQRIIENISFAIEHASILAIIGPNGGGKSTLLKALLDLIPSTGEISWRTKKIGFLPPLDQISKKGLPPLSVADFFQLKSISIEEQKDLLEKVGLNPHYRKKYFDTLSTGEFQRMLIAWTLSGNPGVIVLDEPTAGIDLEGEKMIFSFLKSLPNLTIVLATHHIHIAREIADYILCLNRKQIDFGTPEQISTEEIKQLYIEGGMHND